MGKYTTHSGKCLHFFRTGRRMGRRMGCTGSCTGRTGRHFGYCGHCMRHWARQSSSGVPWSEVTVV